MSDNAKQIKIQYFALLREQRGCSEEEIQTDAGTAAELYAELQGRYGFHLGTDLLRVAINEEFCPWETPLADRDSVVFIPPVAGG